MKLVAFDVETHLIQPGLAAPPLVCAAVADEAERVELLLRADALAELRRLLEDPGVTIGGENVTWDLAVCCAERPDLVPLVFDAVDAGRVVSADVLEKLHANAIGTLREWDSTDLATLELRHTGVDRSADKADGWRYSYALLDGKPLSEWPQEAIDYPRRDAKGVRDVLLKQLEPRRSAPREHSTSWGWPCATCGATEEAAGNGRRCDDEQVGRLNLQCAAQEMRAAWFLALARVWGMRTDPAMVPGVVEKIKVEHDSSRRKFFAAGITRVRKCTKKDGEYERADEVGAEWLAEAEAALRARLGNEPAGWITRRLGDLHDAASALAAGKPIRFAEDKGRLKELVSAAYSGEPPQTEGGATRGPEVSTSRDTLGESGDPMLEEYGESGANEKLFSSFVPMIEQGTSAPICPRFDSTLASQRTSCFSPNLQQLPRKGVIRPTFVPRASWVYCSMDYAGIESATLAEACLEFFGHSKLAEALNAGQDPHVKMASRVLGLSYEEGLARKKARDPEVLNVRQSMKQVNYGKPGLMGPPKMVWVARKDGIRFCEAAGRAPDCRAVERTATYRRRRIAPTCVECLKLAEEWSDLWYEEFPEMRQYHDLAFELAKRAERGEPLESLGTGMLRLETSPGACANHFFQNLNAQGAKHATWLLSREMYADPTSVLYNNARLVLFVHDEALCEFREEVASECAWRATEILKAGMEEYVKRVRVGIEPALMRRWFKGAELAKGRDGRLKPWWPTDPRCSGAHVADCECWSWGPDQEQMARDLAA